MELGNGEAPASTARVPVRGREKKDLDEFCIVKLNDPRTWDHRDHPGTPKRGAFWKLISLFSRRCLRGSSTPGRDIAPRGEEASGVPFEKAGSGRCAWPGRLLSLGALTRVAVKKKPSGICADGARPPYLPH